MNLATQLLLAFGLILLCLIPSIGILEGILTKAKEKEQKIYVLKLNKTWCIVFGVIYLIEFLLGLEILYIPIHFFNQSPWLIVLMPVGIAFCLDLVLFINYIVFETTRTVTYDSINKVIEIEKRGALDKIDLQNEVQDVIRYEAIWQGKGRRRPPGADFAKTIVTTRTDKQYVFSNLLIDGAELEQTLMKNEKFFTANYHQFNFI